MNTSRVCVRCERVLQRGEPYFQQVTAWVAGGKRDSVTLRQDVFPPTFACGACVRRWQDGINDDQGALL